MSVVVAAPRQPLPSLGIGIYKSAMTLIPKEFQLVAPGRDAPGVLVGQRHVCYLKLCFSGQGPSNLPSPV